MNDYLYWLGFSAFPGIGPARFAKLIAFFGQASTAWNANIKDIKNAGIDDSLAYEFDKFRTKFSIFNYAQALKKEKIKFFTLQDADYPSLLAQAKNPPFVLYLKGDLDFSEYIKLKPIAIVGTRKITSYGAQVTNMLTHDLVQAGCAIVSGLAIGVDRSAHLEALANGGKTIAVLASSVDFCTPRENEAIYRRILESGGAIVSETPVGGQVVKGSFLSRNRIIAGLSLAVVVTEGAQDSGALATAKYAAVFQRKIFAIPGPITSNYSKGPNSLIAKGAIPATSAADILSALSITNTSGRQKIKADTKEELLIINLLSDGQMHIDKLIKQMDMTASQASIVLSLMEMKGLVRNCGSGSFALADIS